MGTRTASGLPRTTTRPAVFRTRLWCGNLAFLTCDQRFRLLSGQAKAHCEAISKPFPIGSSTFWQNFRTLWVQCSEFGLAHTALCIEYPSKYEAGGRSRASAPRIIAIDVKKARILSKKDRQRFQKPYGEKDRQAMSETFTAKISRGSPSAKSH